MSLTTDYFHDLFLVSVGNLTKSMVYNNTQETRETGDELPGLSAGLYNFIIIGFAGLILILFSVMKYVRYV